jgi:hypothetical protein
MTAQTVSVARAVVGILEASGDAWRCADIARALGITTHAAATRCYGLERRGAIVRVSRGVYRAVSPTALAPVVALRPRERAGDEPAGGDAA